jgi:hypothetical protein
MGRGLLGLNTLALSHLALALPFAVCPDGPPPSSQELVRDDAPRSGNDLAKNLRQVVDVFHDPLARGRAVNPRVPQAPEHPFLGAHVPLGPDGVVWAEGGGEGTIQGAGTVEVREAMVTSAPASCRPAPLY